MSCILRAKQDYEVFILYDKSISASSLSWNPAMAQTVCCNLPYSLFEDVDLKGFQISYNSAEGVKTFIITYLKPYIYEGHSI